MKQTLVFYKMTIISSAWNKQDVIGSNQVTQHLKKGITSVQVIFFKTCLIKK